MIDESQKLVNLLKKHESYRQFPYHCSEGKLTVGYGRNLEANGISESEADYMLKNDILRFHSECHREFPWFSGLNTARKAVLISMAFNLGTEGVKKFWRMGATLDCGDHATAAAEMRNSLWAKQVGNRADELAEMMETGIFK